MFKYSKEVVRSPIESSIPSKPSTSCLNAYKCEICDKGWQSETEVYYHKREHFRTLKKEVKESNHFCWTCIRKFNTAADLIGHYKMCHLLSSEDAQRVEHEIFVCNICSKVFFNKKMLEVHITHLHRKSNPSKKWYDCPQCNKKVKGHYIWGHFRFHNMIGLYTCPICLTRRPNWDELKIHLKSHPLYMKCDMCSENFDKSFKFTEHIQKHKLNSEVKDIADDDDEEIKQAIDEYFIPRNSSPKGIKYGRLLPYQGLRLVDKVKICVLCREICTSYKERKQHIIYHKENRPELQQNLYEKQKYVCSCGEMFMQKILLKQHLLKNKAAEFVHEALSESDIIHLMSNPEEYTILEIV